MKTPQWAAVIAVAAVAGYVAMFALRFPSDSPVLDLAAPERAWNVVYFVGDFVFMFIAIGIGPLTAPRAGRLEMARAMSGAAVVFIASTTLLIVMSGSPPARLFAFITGLASTCGALAAAWLWSRCHTAP